MNLRTLFAVVLSCAGAFAQSASKTAAAVDTALVFYGGISPGVGATGWQQLLSTDIKPPGGKDLLITVSMQSGLFNFNLSSPTLFLQFSGLRVRVIVDGDVANPVSPGPVTWDRQLNFLLEQTPQVEANLKSGVRAFTFIKRNVGVGNHKIEVQGNFQFADFEAAGLAGSFAYVTNRSLTVEEVSLK